VNPLRAGLPGGLVVDLMLLGLAGLAARTGWRRGAVVPAFGLAGLLVALAVGLTVAARLGAGSSPLVHLGGDVLVVLLAVMIGRRVGRRLGQPVAAGLRAAGLGRLDAAGGAVLRAAVVLTGCWLLASLLTVLAPPVVAAPIGDSQVMGALDRALPTPVGRLAGASARLGLSALPAGLLGLIPAGAPLPSHTQLAAAVTLASRGTVAVHAQGCGRESAGSGFAVTRGLVVTNAHVVAGSPTVTVTDASGTHPATPVLYDQGGDLAVLSVPGLTATGLSVAAQPAASGTPLVALGYPGGGPLAASPAVVELREPALQPAAGGMPVLPREVYVLHTIVRPGNSGGPLVDTTGRVRGVVDAYSVLNPQTGFALTTTRLIHDLSTARAASSPVSTGSGCTTQP